MFVQTIETQIAEASQSLQAIETVEDIEDLSQLWRDTRLKMSPLIYVRTSFVCSCLLTQLYQHSLHLGVGFCVQRRSL